MNQARKEVIFRDQKPRYSAREGSRSNWVLIVGGAVLTAVSVRFWCKLNDILYGKQPENGQNGSKVNMRPSPALLRSAHSLDSDSYCGAQNGEEYCYRCLRGSGEFKHASCSPASKDSDLSLQLVTIPGTEASKDNAAITWISSPDHSKPFHPSASSGSPSPSESGSDIFSKREVIQKLRQQLKRRDEMIIDMQGQISELQNSLTSHTAHSSCLQSQLDAVNHLLFNSELEIQRLRKTITDRCLAGSVVPEKPADWQSDLNGDANGYINGTHDKDMLCVSSEKSSDYDRIEMLRREIVDLKEVIEGKEFLIQSYKEQKTELCSKITDLQSRLSLQTLTIL